MRSASEAGIVRQDQAPQLSPIRYGEPDENGNIPTTFYETRVVLSPTEHELLEFLRAREGAFTHVFEIPLHYKGREADYSRIRSTYAQLRSKLEKDPTHPQYFKSTTTRTNGGIGYFPRPKQPQSNT